jgi:hypothetical protein
MISMSEKDISGIDERPHPAGREIARPAPQLLSSIAALPANRSAIPRKQLPVPSPTCRGRYQLSPKYITALRVGECALVERYAHAATHDEIIFVVVDRPN